jgi:hypothetical protein
MPKADRKTEGGDFAQLRRAKDETLKELLARKPGQKHYRRALKAYLEADDALQRAIIQRLELDLRA